MSDNHSAKKLINYLEEIRDSSDYYQVTPFTDVFLSNEEKRESEDFTIRIGGKYKLIDYIQNTYIDIGDHIKINFTNLPPAIMKLGYIIEPCKEKYKFTPRNNEINKMKVIINKKIKNNILLVGNPGTGKTTLVNMFAETYNLNNIFVVECLRLMNGTELRGSLEKKIIELLNFALEYNLILFFDEMHSLINLGKVEGGLSLTDILKPYLSMNKITFIGATTLKESKLLFLDEAFKRRFSVVYIKEPDFGLLLQIKNELENNYFKNKLLNKSETIQVIKLLKNKLKKLYFPDKFVDFLDYLNSLYDLKYNINYKISLRDYINEQRMEKFN